MCVPPSLRHLSFALFPLGRFVDHGLLPYMEQQFHMQEVCAAADGLERTENNTNREQHLAAEKKGSGANPAEKWHPTCFLSCCGRRRVQQLEVCVECVTRRHSLLIERGQMLVCGWNIMSARVHLETESHATRCSDVRNPKLCDTQMHEWKKHTNTTKYFKFT